MEGMTARYPCCTFISFHPAPHPPPPGAPLEHLATARCIACRYDDDGSCMQPRRFAGRSGATGGTQAVDTIYAGAAGGLYDGRGDDASGAPGRRPAGPRAEADRVNRWNGYDTRRERRGTNTENETGDGQHYAGES